MNRSLPLVLLLGCGPGLGVYPPDKTPAGDTGTVDGDGDTDSDADTDSDTDADTDSDTDADTDSDTDTDTDSDTDTDTGPPPWVNGDPAVPPSVPTAPPDLPTTCAAAGMIPAPITDDPDNEVVIDGVSDTSDTHMLDVPTAGWYHLWNDPPANDGAAQWNESAFLRIRNTTFPTGSTVLTNCASDWVAVDVDGVAPVPLAQYLGTFWFDAGTNTVDVFHFCAVVRAGICTNLENTTDPNTTCANDGNRLRMVSDGLCVQEP
jgi:hypothetical protein